MTMALSSFIIITVKISIKDLYTCSCLNSSINPWYKMILLGLFTDHRNAQQIASYKKKKQTNS